MPTMDLTRTLSYSNVFSAMARHMKPDGLASAALDLRVLAEDAGNVSQRTFYEDMARALEKYSAADA
jgi:hypothetical protein